MITAGEGYIWDHNYMHERSEHVTLRPTWLPTYVQKTTKNSVSPNFFFLSKNKRIPKTSGGKGVVLTALPAKTKYGRIKNAAIILDILFF